jgi:hypothetical protein
MGQQTGCLHLYDMIFWLSGPPAHQRSDRRARLVLHPIAL